MFARQRRVVTLIGVLVSVSVLVQPVALAAPVAEPVILIFGDSLSAGAGLQAGEGWVDLLEARLAAEGYSYRVVNASMSGERVMDGRQRLLSAVETDDPAIVVLQVGSDDVVSGTPVDVVKQNLAAMIGLLKAKGTRLVLVGVELAPQSGVDYQAFNRVCVELSDELGVPLVQSLLAGASQPELRQADGRPNAAAQPMLLANVWGVLAPALAKD